MRRAQRALGGWAAFLRSLADAIFFFDFGGRVYGLLHEVKSPNGTFKRHILPIICDGRAFFQMRTLNLVDFPATILFDGTILELVSL